MGELPDQQCLSATGSQPATDASGAAAAAPAPGSPAPAATPRHTIALVDDDRNILTSLAMALHAKV